MKHLLLLGVAAALLAQTAITPGQVALESAVNAKPVLVAIVDGKFVTVSLDPSLVVTQTATGYTIAAPVVKPAGLRRLTQNADGTYPPFSGVLFRNGLAQSVGEDYEVLTGAVKTRAPWAASDIVAVLER